jgi:hypothetical protein
MTMLSIVLLAAGATVVLAEMLVLDRHRRAFLRYPERVEVFVRPSPEGRRSDASTPAAEAAPERVAPPLASPTAGIEPVHAREPHDASEGVVYVSPNGGCTFASPAARALLHWSGSPLDLGDLLAGGHEESSALLASLARQGAVDQHATMVNGPPPEAVNVRAVALRDRDDNFWGAAFFVRRPPTE